MRKIEGGELMDIIKDPIGYVKDLAGFVPNRLNNVSQSTLKQYGSFAIGPKVDILRTPLNRTWTGALNTISLGAFDKIQGDAPLYHTALVFYVAGQPIVVEKNEVVNVEHLAKSGAVKPNTEKLALNNPTNQTLNEILDKTLKRMGETKFYDYNAMSSRSEDRNNCQDFVKNVLLSANLWNQQAENFLYQDLTHLKKGFEKENVGFVPTIVKGVTRLGSYMSRVIGKGGKTKEDKNLIKFIKFVENKGYRFI